jgi:GAF domain-containing protein
MDFYQGPLRVGFVELPDEALDILTHYTQRDDVEVVLVASLGQDSYAVKMAEILKIPLLDVPNRLALSGCERVIVGPRPEEALDQVRDALEGTDIEILTTEQAFGIMKEEEAKVKPAPPVAPTRRQGDPEPAAPREDEPEFTQNADPNDPLLRLSPDLDLSSPTPPTAPAAAPDSPEELERLPREDFEVRQPGESVERTGKTPQPIPRPNNPYGKQPAPEAPTPAPAPAPQAARPPQPAPVPETISFDVSSILGSDVASEGRGVTLDTSRGDRLQQILSTAIRALHAQTGSIMLLDKDGSHLRIAVAVGLPEHIIQGVRQPVGTGIAGSVFAGGKGQIVRGRVRRQGQDRGLRPQLRAAAVVPILRDNRPIGVLSVNVESEKIRLDERSLLLLARFANETSSEVLKALSVSRLEGPARREALLAQVVRLMKLEDTLPNRLRAVADTLRKAYDADFAHAFLLDPVGKRLEMITPRRGVAVSRPEFVPMDRGLLGWVTRHGEPRVLETWDAAGEEGMATLFVPIRNGSPRGLLVLENIRLTAQGTAEALVASLNEITAQLGETIEMEKTLEAQEVLAQLQYRVAEQSARFAGLLPHERARAVLEFAVELLAAETAAWVRHADARPIWARPQTSNSTAVQTDFKPLLDSLVGWVGDNEQAAGGVALPGWDAQAPTAPAPYLGVRLTGTGNVLLLMFSPEEEAGPLIQIPPDVLLEVLRLLGEHLPHDSSRAA